MSERLYRIKPLEWTRLNEELRPYYYQATIGAEIVKPQYAVRQGPSSNWRFSIGGDWQPCESLQAGQSACEAHWRARLEAVLEPVEVKP